MKRPITIILLAALILTSIPNDALAFRPIAYQVSLRSDAGGSTPLSLDEGLLELDRMVREKLAEAKVSGKETVVVAIDGRPGVGSSYIAQRIKDAGIAGMSPEDISYIERDRYLTALSGGSDVWTDIFLSNFPFRERPGLVLLEGYGVAAFCQMFGDSISEDKRPDIFMNIIADEDSRRYYLWQKNLPMKIQLKRFPLQQDDYAFDLVIDNSLSGADREGLGNRLALLKQAYEEWAKNREQGFAYKLKVAIWKIAFGFEVLINSEIILPLLFSFSVRNFVRSMRRLVSIADVISGCIKDSTFEYKIRNKINNSLAHIAYAVLEWERDLFPEGPTPAIVSTKVTEEQIIEILEQGRAVLLFITDDKEAKFAQMLESIAVQGHDLREIYRFKIDDYLSSDDKTAHFIYSIGMHFDPTAIRDVAGPTRPDAVLNMLIKKEAHPPESKAPSAGTLILDRYLGNDNTALNRLDSAA